MLFESAPGAIENSNQTRNFPTATNANDTFAPNAHS